MLRRVKKKVWLLTGQMHVSDKYLREEWVLLEIDSGERSVTSSAEVHNCPQRLYHPHLFRKGGDLQT